MLFLFYHLNFNLVYFIFIWLFVYLIWIIHLVFYQNYLFVCHFHKSNPLWLFDKVLNNLLKISLIFWFFNYVAISNISIVPQSSQQFYRIIKKDLFSYYEYQLRSYLNVIFSFILLFQLKFFSLTPLLCLFISF